MNIAIIPARKNSKRIKNKNIKKFFSKPIIYYPIEKCIGSKIFDQIIISSDSNEYIRLIKNKFKNCLFHKRTKKNSNHTSTTRDFLNEIINYYKFDDQTKFCCIYPCNPLLSKNTLTKTYNKFRKNKYDLLFTISKSGISKEALFSLKNGLIDQNSISADDSLNSQYQKKYFKDCGQLYWFNRKHIVKEKNLFKGKIGTHILKENEYHDIDNDIDWEIAKLKFKINEQNF